MKSLKKHRLAIIEILIVLLAVAAFTIGLFIIGTSRPQGGMIEALQCESIANGKFKCKTSDGDTIFVYDRKGEPVRVSHK